MASRLSRWVLWRVFVRSLFLQASWNVRGMQNLGIAFALFPALEKLYPNPQLLQKALERHLTFFNTQPYMAAALLGGMVHLEEKVARGEETPQKVESFKKALQGPLAAVGDGFFWLSLRPMAAAVACLLLPFSGLWAAAVFLGVYNSVHWGLRARLFAWGLSLGERLVEPISRANLPRKGLGLRKVGAGCVGAVACGWALVSGTLASPVASVWGVVGAVVVAGVAYGLSVRRVNAYVLFYLAAAGSVAAFGVR